MQHNKCQCLISIHYLCYTAQKVSWWGWFWMQKSFWSQQSFSPEKVQGAEKEPQLLWLVFCWRWWIAGRAICSEWKWNMGIFQLSFTPCSHKDQNFWAVGGDSHCTFCGCSPEGYSTVPVVVKHLLHIVSITNSWLCNTSKSICIPHRKPILYNRLF